MSESGLPISLFSRFIAWLYSAGEIELPSDFHGRCQKVQEITDLDCSGVVNTLNNYAIESAASTKYRIECDDNTLQKLLNSWLSQINLDVNNIPTGLSSLSKEYFKERWAGSSFCALKVSNWKSIIVENTSIEVPTLLWFVNGSSIYVKRNKKDNFVLGSDEYYLDRNYEIKLIPNGKKESSIIQKPYNRWYDQYATPYLFKNGVYKNWKAMQILQNKGNQAITKVLPYLFMMVKGNETLFKEGVDYSDTELTEMVDNFKSELERFQAEGRKVPAHGVPFDQKYEHLIPDLSKIVSEELYRQGYRAILSGMGFIDVIQGLSSTRRESILNPKPFISEINSGVADFKSILLEVIYKIVDKNKSKHRKLFSDKGKIFVTNSPLKINIEQILDAVRSGYDRGPISIQSYAEALGFDYETEKERRTKEAKEGMEELFYPHVISNQEDKGKDVVIPSKPKTKKQENLEDEGKNPPSPEIEKYKNAEWNIEESKIDETDQYYRVRQIEPSEFEEDSFRTIWLDKAKGIKAVIGKKKGETKTTVQTLLFLKEKWTKKEIKKWIKEHANQFHAYIEIAEANLQEDLIEAPYTKTNYPKYLDKYPAGAREAFIKTFNKIYEKTKDESKAFPIAWNALKRWLKKHNYTFKKGFWEKKTKEELENAELKKKQKRLLDKLLESDGADKNENI